MIQSIRRKLGKPKQVSTFNLTTPTFQNSYRYLRETIHHGSEKAAIGPIIKGDAGKGDYAADLGYRGDTAASYDEKVYEVKGVGKKTSEAEKADAMGGLIELTRFIASYNSSTQQGNAFDQWNQIIDVKHFLRQVACEWLGGNWDGVVYCKNQI